VAYVVYKCKPNKNKEDFTITKNETVTATQEVTPPLNFKQHIGSTLYTVSVHYSQTSTETAEDKVLRLIKCA